MSSAPALFFDPPDADFELRVGPELASSLDVESFVSHEAMSRTFVLEITARAPFEHARPEVTLVGQRAAFAVLRDGGAARQMSGVIASASVDGLVGGALRVRLRVVPDVALLVHRVTSRVFHERTVPQIVELVLSEGHVRTEWRLTASYRRLEYCVQYQESDYDFVARLLAEEGIFFHFEIADDPTHGPREVLVLSDDSSGYRPLEGDEVLPFADADGMHAGGEHVSAFRVRHAVTPMRTVLREFDFRRPQLVLEASDRRSSAPPASTNSIRPERLEVYEHHSDYLDPDLAPARASRRTEARKRAACTVHGRATSPRLAPGGVFALEGHDLVATDERFVVVRVEQRGRSARARQGRAAPGRTYESRFVAVPESTPFRPMRKARASRQVLESATVVGPAGEEIHTDELGRVKVQFHWDRDGARDEHSSCWIRVAQPWAGAGYGFQFVPRVGDEVLVSFLGGDTDAPVIVGAAYNAVRPTPFALPAEKTRSGIRTNSTPGGTAYNEISFEDRAGGERLRLHAGRDLEETVIHDRVVRVGHDATLSIDGDRRSLVRGDAIARTSGASHDEVGADDRRDVGGRSALTVGGDRDVAVRGDARTRIDGRTNRDVGGESKEVVRGDSVLRVHGHATTIVGRHEATRSSLLFVEGTAETHATEEVTITADESITLRCGKSWIRLTPEGIEIHAPKTTLRSSELAIAADGVKVSAKKQIAVRGDAVRISSRGAHVALSNDARIDGAKVILNGGPDEADATVPPADPVVPTKIKLTDDEGNPIAHARAVVVEGDDEVSFVLDAEGEAEIAIEAGSEIRFPDFDDVVKE